MAAKLVEQEAECACGTQCEKSGQVARQGTDSAGREYAKRTGGGDDPKGQSALPWVGDGVSPRQLHPLLCQAAGLCALPAATMVRGGSSAAPMDSSSFSLTTVSMARTRCGAGRGPRAGKHDSVESNPNEWGLGKTCAGNPPARFDKGESYIVGDHDIALYFYPTGKLPQKNTRGTKGGFGSARA